MVGTFAAPTPPHEHLSVPITEPGSKHGIKVGVSHAGEALQVPGAVRADEAPSFDLNVSKIDAQSSNQAFVATNLNQSSFLGGSGMLALAQNHSSAPADHLSKSDASHVVGSQTTAIAEECMPREVNVNLYSDSRPREKNNQPPEELKQAYDDEADGPKASYSAQQQ